MLSLSPSDTQALVQFTRDLVRTPSFSGQEGAVAALVTGTMRAIGFQDVWVDRIGNVIGRYGAGRGPKLLYNGHMDTVEVGERRAWSHDPFGGVVENGILYGRGAADMKAGLAAMIYSVKLLADARAQLNGDLYVAAVVQEEPSEGLAMRVLVEEEGFQPDFVVLGEPTNLGICLGHRGRVELRVTTYGRAAHSSAPQQGINAIYGAARLVFGIELLAPHLLNDPRLGQGTVAVTQMTSFAVSPNAIPDRCHLLVDRRLTLGETEARAIAEIQQIIKREGVRADVAPVEFEATSYTGYVSRGRKYYPPWLLSEDSPLVRGAARAAERALGRPPRLGVWSFSTDGAYTMGVAGIPTIGFGPGEDRFVHTMEEQVRLADVAQAARTYAQLAVEMLK
jgi:putative selenium metabolism hydrolase